MHLTFWCNGDLINFDELELKFWFFPRTTKVVEIIIDAPAEKNN